MPAESGVLDLADFHFIAMIIGPLSVLVGASIQTGSSSNSIRLRILSGCC
jgi:hypothetical protein